MSRFPVASRAIVRALEARGSEVTWGFAHAHAMEAAHEAETFLREKLEPYIDKTDWSEEDYADLMRLEFQYQDMSRYSRQLMDALLLRPAPTVEALLWKMDYLAKGRAGYHRALPALALTRIVEDMRRLMGAAADAILAVQRSVADDGSAGEVVKWAKSLRPAWIASTEEGGEPGEPGRRA